MYCDYAAATPVAPAVAARIDTIQRTIYGNPSSVHALGVAARRVLTESRDSVARTLGVHAGEVYFTGSGTEANNLAILGHIEALVAAGAEYTSLEVVTTQLEHPSVLTTIEMLAERGVRVRYLTVDTAGHITPEAVTETVRPETTLVTFAYANSEVGTVQPVRRLVRAIRQVSSTARIHLDAAQAPLWLPCGRHRLGVDMLTLDAGKCNGPKGVGILVCAHDVPLRPLLGGGGQERDVRPGTENVAGIAGAARALELAQAATDTRAAAVYPATQALVQALREQVPQAIYNGPSYPDSASDLQRLPNSVHLSLPGVDTEYAVVYLDHHGIAASTKSACSGAGGGLSTVIYALTADRARAQSTLRFSLDPTLTPAAVTHVATILAQFVALQQSID